MPTPRPHAIDARSSTRRRLRRYIIATVASMVTSTDAKQAIYRERMEQLRSWMRHYRFGLALRRRTRRFFKEYYASHSAIDDNAILADLAPDLQRDVADYLLRASVWKSKFGRPTPSTRCLLTHWLISTQARLDQAPPALRGVARGLALEGARDRAHGVARRRRRRRGPRPAVVDFIYCAGGPRRDVV